MNCLNIFEINALLVAALENIFSHYEACHLEINFMYLFFWLCQILLIVVECGIFIASCGIFCCIVGSVVACGLSHLKHV